MEENNYQPREKILERINILKECHEKFKEICNETFFENKIHSFLNFYADITDSVKKELDELLDELRESLSIGEE